MALLFTFASASPPKHETQKCDCNFPFYAHKSKIVKIETTEGHYRKCFHADISGREEDSDHTCVAVRQI